MKKAISFFLIIIPLLGIGQDTLVKWTFPTNTSDTANGGIPANLSTTISVQGGTSALTFPAGATTYCASTTKWNTGNGTKYWQIKIVTLGYSNILLSSKQYSSGTGPQGFKTQYSTDYSVTWNDFPGNAVTVATNWTSGKLVNVPLTSACDNKDTVYVRWIMASDTAVNDTALVKSTGSSKIDDIIVTGTLIPQNIEQYQPLANIVIAPDPAQNYVYIYNLNVPAEIKLFDIIGNLINVNTSIEKSNDRVTFGNITKGMYFLQIKDNKTNCISTKKLLITN